MTTYFVLKGLVNGEEGEFAVPSGGSADKVQPDGWYYLLEGEANGRGPFNSRKDAEYAGRRETQQWAIDELAEELYNGDWVEDILRKCAERGLDKDEAFEVIEQAVTFIQTHHIEDAYPDEYK